jgi:hypothetical protein
MTHSKETEKEMINLVYDLANIICESPHGIPSGHLYAMVMKSLSYDAFINLQSCIVATGKVKLENNLLSRATWPTFEEEKAMGYNPYKQE